MQHFPMIKIELNGVRETIQHMFSESNKSFVDAISATLQKTLTQEWVEAEINREVTRCVEKAITDISNNWQLKVAITDLVAQQLTKLVEGRRP